MPCVCVSLFACLWLTVLGVALSGVDHQDTQSGKMRSSYVASSSIGQHRGGGRSIAHRINSMDVAVDVEH